MKTKRVRRRKLDPKLRQKLIARMRKLKMDPKLLERILPPGRLPKLKVTPQFRARFLAYAASHDLRAFADTIRNAAFARDDLFFKYLAEYLKKKPIRLPISEKQRELLKLHYQKPNLSASEALNELDYPSKEHYRSEKLRALKRSKLMDQVWRDGWLE
jgi:hypothetical protein